MIRTRTDYYSLELLDLFRIYMPWDGVAEIFSALQKTLSMNRTQL